MTEPIDPLDFRNPDHEIDPIFPRRWSPRAMSGKTVERATMLRLFEAARWAASTYNEQEWRFCYALRETEYFATFFDLLVEGNQAWCGPAGALGIVLSTTTFARNGKPNPVHEFDTGMAYGNLALQGSQMNLVVHAMAGFDKDAARQVLNLPDDIAVHCMFAVGHPGNPADLPDDLRNIERPSGRKPVQEFAHEGRFDF
jgi:nitroreductase